LKQRIRGLAAALLLSCQSPADPNAIRLPEGFHSEVYAKVPGARHLSVAPDGTIFVGTLQDKVYAVTSRRQVIELARGLNKPNGVAFGPDGALYICEISRLMRLPKILSHLSHPPAPEVVHSQLPDREHHGYRVLRFGPDQRLYIGIGAPCNVGENPDPFGSLCRFSKDFRQLEVYARGVRNTMGFDWNPTDETLWFSDNGRDFLGDDLPPEELNQAPQPGLHFGFPYRYGNNQPDPEWGNKAGPRTFQAPKITLQAHMAPLGLRFYTGTQFPPSYKNRMFLACHGSWNRTSPVGYKVMVADTRSCKSEVFAYGWEREGKVSGRPVDVQPLPDGSLIVSDDYAGNLYRIRYQK